jgi:putative hydrolase of the HAD superfamily
MIRAVLFDLDDTLYPEGDFYRGGFAVVAAELERRGVAEARRIRDEVIGLHFGGSRERVFDAIAERFGFPRRWVPELVSLFHAHQPRLRLCSDAPAVLRKLRPRFRLGIVTDGHAEVQRRKIAALGVEPLVDAVVVADDFGRDRWKPHPWPFLTCCRDLDVAPDQAVFVGDNPSRDVTGAHNAGLASIRIARPGAFFRDVPDAPPHRPAFGIESLDELESVLGRIDRETRAASRSPDALTARLNPL